MASVDVFKAWQKGEACYSGGNMTCRASMAFAPFYNEHIVKCLFYSYNCAIACRLFRKDTKRLIAPILQIDSDGHTITTHKHIRFTNSRDAATIVVPNVHNVIPGGEPEPPPETPSRPSEQTHQENLLFILDSIIKGLGSERRTRKVYKYIDNGRVITNVKKSILDLKMYMGSMFLIESPFISCELKSIAHLLKNIPTQGTKDDVVRGLNIDSLLQLKKDLKALVL